MGLDDSKCFFFGPQEMEKKDSIEITAITPKHLPSKARDLFEARAWGIKGCVVSEGFEVIVNQQIHFIQSQMSSKVFVAFVGTMSQKCASQSLKHLIRRIVASA